MFERKAWLRFVFFIGAVTDAFALAPLLSSRISALMWGLPDVADGFMRGYAATLMLGWTALLVWAYRRPVERAAVAAMTAILIHGLAITEIVAVATGSVPLVRVAPTLVLQAILFAGFAIAYHGRPRALVRDDVITSRS
jgi:hypothetical protein